MFTEFAARVSGGQSQDHSVAEICEGQLNCEPEPDPPVGPGSHNAAAGVTPTPDRPARRPIATTPAESASTPPQRPWFATVVDSNPIGWQLARPPGRADADAVRVRVDAPPPFTMRPASTMTPTAGQNASLTLDII